MRTTLLLISSSILLLNGVTPHSLLAQTGLERQLIHQYSEKPYSSKNQTTSTCISKKLMQNRRSLPLLQQRVASFHHSFSKIVGESLATIGLISSMIVSSPETLFFQQPVTNLHHYLQETGIGEEFGSVFNRKMFGPLRTLSKIQSKYRASNDVRDLLFQNKTIPPMQEAAR